MSAYAITDGLSDYLKNNTERVYSVSLMLSVIASIAIFHELPVLSNLSYLAIWSLMIAALFNPAIGLVSLFPVLYILPSAPTVLGWPEISFAALLLISSLSTVVHHSRELVNLFITKSNVVIWLGLVLTGANYWVAMRHDIPISDWIRGIVPFLFIYFTIIFFLVLKSDRVFKYFFVMSIAVTALLFSFRVIETYVSNSLWEPSSYIFEYGKWVHIPLEKLANYDAGSVYNFPIRVTILLQQSTDVLVPIGVVWGVIGAVLLSKKKQRIFFGLLAVTSLIAIILTYTRSMLLSAGIVVFFSGLFFLYLGWPFIKRYLIMLCILGVLAIVSIKITGLEEVYKNRFNQLTNVTVNNDNVTVKDDNLTARLEEYKIAWDMFLEAPILGKGLGIKHEMNFSAGFGEILKQKVAYVHNWVFYFLMVSGVAGFVYYSIILGGPALIALFSSDASVFFRMTILGTVGFMAIYGLFFAVFRLIPFNLLLATILAYAMLQKAEKA